MYTLTLTLDSDARQLAHRARDAGATTVAVIASDAPLQQRFATAFNAEWILAGGDAPVMFRFDRAPDVLRALRRDLTKTPLRRRAPRGRRNGRRAGEALRQVDPDVHEQSGQRASVRAKRSRDLDDVRFVDIPWLVDPDATLVRRTEAPRLSERRARSPVRARHRCLSRRAGVMPTARRNKLEFDGATGRLSLDAARQFVREGTADGLPVGPGRVGRDALTMTGCARRRGRAGGGAGGRIPRRAGHRRSSSATSAGDAARSISSRRDGDTLVFVEVRLRTRGDFGGAAASITAKKRCADRGGGRTLPRAPPPHAALPVRRSAARRPRPGAHRVAEGLHGSLTGGMARRCDTCYNHARPEITPFPWITFRASARISPTARS